MTVHLLFFSKTLRKLCAYIACLLCPWLCIFNDLCHHLAFNWWVKVLELAKKENLLIIKRQSVTQFEIRHVSGKMCKFDYLNNYACVVQS